VTNCLRVGLRGIGQTVRMDRDSYIDPVVEDYMPDASDSEKLAVMAEIWVYFDMLLERVDKRERFDSSRPNMIESDSHRPDATPPL
jgi:hypothetical protein